jgi:pimeloyl-ACP methyl ester carboxylesterase
MTARSHDGWEIRESGPADAQHAALLLPGGLCTAEFYDDVLAEPGIGDAPVRWVAATTPGFGGTAPLDDMRFESYATAAAQLATELGCDVIVGHSMGANLAIEMVVSGQFAGPVVLLSPSFSRADEAKEFAFLDRVGRVPGLGMLAWKALLKGLPRAMKKELPAERADALIACMLRNDAVNARAAVREYFDYFERAGALASRLCESGVPAWVAFGDGKNEVGLADDERQLLESCASVELVTLEGSGHMGLVDQPARVAELVLAAVSAAAPA